MLILVKNSQEFGRILEQIYISNIIKIEMPRIECGSKPTVSLLLSSSSLIAAVIQSVHRRRRRRRRHRRRRLLQFSVQFSTSLSLSPSPSLSL